MPGPMDVARRGTLAVALAVAAPIVVATTTAAPAGAALPACTKTWIGATGTWSDATKWSGGTVPTATDHVCITQVGSATVTLDGDGAGVTVASLRVGNPEPGTDTQTLVLTRGVANDDTSLVATGGIEIRARGTIELGESAAASVSIGVGDGAEIANAGTIRQTTGTSENHQIRADVVNTGTLRLDQGMRITGALTTDGTLQVNHVLHVEDTVWTKGGTVRGDWLVVAYDGLRVGAADTDISAGAPPFTVEGGAIAFEDDSPIDITSRGPVTLSGDTGPGQDIKVQSIEGIPAVLTFDGTWTNRGHLGLEPGVADARIAGAEAGATLVNEGEIDRYDTDQAGGASIGTDVVNRGSLGISDDTLDIDGGLENEGDIDLGLGRLSVGGDVILDPSSAVGIDIEDAATAGRLDVDATATIRGRLLVDTDTPIVPAVGTTVTAVTADSRLGTFADVAFAGAASWDTTYTGTGVDLVRRASESPGRRFVRAVYQDFVDRQPLRFEVEGYGDAIDDGYPRAILVRRLVEAYEYVATIVQRFYADTLDRPGDEAGVDYWVDQILTGRKTVAQVAGSFYASPEYFTRAGGSNAAWIGDLYDVFFDRAPSDDDLGYWVPRIQQRGRTRVAIELFQSLESRRQRVDALYGSLLQRASDPGGRDYWAGRITAEGDLALAVHLAASGEYLMLAQERYP